MVLQTVSFCNAFMHAIIIRKLSLLLFRYSQFCQFYKPIKFTELHPNYFLFQPIDIPKQLLLSVFFHKQFLFKYARLQLNLVSFSIIIEIMHTKLSMKNLHTFGQENPFLRQRSVSYKSKNQSLAFAYQSSTSTFKEKKHQNGTKNEYKILKDSTNRVEIQPTPTQKQCFSPRMSSPLHVGPGSFSFKQFDESKRPYLQGKYKNYSCEGIIHLLKHQGQSIKRVKEIIENDKEKINKHFADFKQTINNIIDDLKLSICCHIEEQYQQFVKSFRIVKIQYVNYCNIKKQFWEIREGEVEKSQKDTNRFTQIGSGNKGKSILQLPGMINTDKSMVNNQMLLMSVIEDIKDCKKHINYKEFAQIQQKLLRPLLSTAKSMLKQLSIQSYYKPEIAYHTFKKLQGSFEDSLHEMYERMDLFITDHRRQQQQQNQVLSKRLNPKKVSEGEERPRQDDKKIDPEKQYQSGQFKSGKENKKNAKQGQIYVTKAQGICDDLERMKTQSFGSISRELEIAKKQKYKSTANTMTNTCGQSQQLNEKQEFFQVNKDKANANSQNNGEIDKIAFNSQRTRKNKYIRHSLDANSFTSLSKQTIRFEQCRTILDKSISSEPNKLSQGSESALCLIYLQSQNKIAVGTKNGLVKIFCTKTGAKLNELYGHRASICSLSTLVELGNVCEYIVSGGDIGCCQVIIWNLRDNSAYHNFSQHHFAAITCIIDLQDSKHFVTGSFDCNLNVFNYKKKQLTKSINTSQKITTLTAMNSSHHKYIVSGNLNSQISVWKVCQNTFNNITGLQLSRTISIGTYPYSIVPMNSSSVMIGGKDNWVRVVNLWEGKVEKAGQIGQCQEIIQLAGAKMNEQQSELIGCFKNGDMRVISTKGQELKSEYSIGKGNVISFSCGISPKYGVQLVAEDNQYGYVYVPNHFNPNHTQIRVWKILKNQKRNLNGRTY